MKTERIGDIPILWKAPSKITNNLKLVIWLPGFTEAKEDTQVYLSELVDAGYVALSFDPLDHGERRCPDNGEELTPESGRFRVPETGLLYRHFWSIEAETAEEIPLVIDWAIADLGVSERVGIGGKSMGGDIAVVAAALDRRIKAVAACIATPDWLKPGSIYELSAPNPKIQDQYERFNPLTNLDRYAHCPAITFQCGGADTMVPPDGAKRFVDSLGGIYSDQPEKISYCLHQDIEHELTDAMWHNSLAWLKRFL